MNANDEAGEKYHRNHASTAGDNLPAISASLLSCGCGRASNDQTITGAVSSLALLAHQHPQWTEQNIGVRSQISMWRVSSDIAEPSSFAKGRSLVRLVEGVW